MNGIEEKNNIMVPGVTEHINKTLQSLFYTLNGKPDSKTKIFNRDICVGLDDIDDLNNRVIDKLKSHYSLKDSINLINININFDDGRNLNFSGWDTYKKTKITNPSSVKKITIIWDCLLKLPNYKMPQRHKLTVKITDGMKPQELLNLVFSGKIEEVEDINIDSPVVASVDFIDSQIGDELINIVDVWIKTVIIEESKQSTIMTKLARHRRKCSYFINWITTIIAVASVFYIIRGKVLLYSGELLGNIPANAVAEWLTITFFGFLFCFIIYRISYYVSNNIFRILERHGEIHVFKITKGDTNEIEAIKNRQARSWKKISRNFLITIVMDLICTGLAALIINLFS
ncbi:hypothetical protein [Thomasclavelia spiroformis]|uniref:hypothetical protein n=1 Tax=Thomasclavelia spiroformis TaxID=29348 RepID=UPI0039A06F87